MSFIRKHKGQSVLEALLVTKLLIITLTAALTVTYLSFAKLWLGFTGREALICIHSGHSKSKCQQKAIKRITSSLPSTDIKTIRFSRTATNNRIDIEIKTFFHVALHSTKKLKLDLTSGEF